MNDTCGQDTDATLPKCNPSAAQAILEVAVELHPKLLTARELSTRIAADLEDKRGGDPHAGNR